MSKKFPHLTNNNAYKSDVHSIYEQEKTKFIESGKELTPEIDQQLREHASHVVDSVLNFVINYKGPNLYDLVHKNIKP